MKRVLRSDSSATSSEVLLLRELIVMTSQKYNLQIAYLLTISYVMNVAVVR